MVIGIYKTEDMIHLVQQDMDIFKDFSQKEFDDEEVK